MLDLEAEMREELVHLGAQPGDDEARLRLCAAAIRYVAFATPRLRARRTGDPSPPPSEPRRPAGGD